MRAARVYLPKDLGKYCWKFNFFINCHWRLADEYRWFILFILNFLSFLCIGATLILLVNTWWPAVHGPSIWSFTFFIIIIIYRAFSNATFSFASGQHDAVHNFYEIFYLNIFLRFVMISWIVHLAQIRKLSESSPSPAKCGEELKG